MSVTTDPTSSTAGPGLARRIAVLILLVVAIAALAWLLATQGPSLLSASDFVEYWAASRLNRAGGNPYDPAQMMALQRSVGWEEELPLMMWNPPWTLPLVAPFGWLPYDRSRIVWILSLISTVITSSYLSWKAYDGPSRRFFVALIPTLLQLPTLAALNLGQISPLILLGVSGFLYASKRGSWALAGAAAVLLSLKPQLLYLFWPIFLLWCIQEKRWLALAGCGVTVLGLSGLALVQNPSVLGQYIHASTNQPPLYYMSSTPGTVLRLLFGWERRWLQFAPSVLGLIWALWYWRRHHASWEWGEHLPVLLFVSVGTAAYGWTHDLVVLAPFMVEASIWVLQRRSALSWGMGVLGHLAPNVGALLYIVGMDGKASWDGLWWMPWVLLLSRIALGRIISTRSGKVS